MFFFLEFATWYPDIQVCKCHANEKTASLDAIADGTCQVLLTRLGTLAIEEVHEDVSKFKWALMVVDEAHELKNPKSKRTKLVKGLPTKVKIGLSGTLIQNNLTEVIKLKLFLYFMKLHSQ